MSSSYLLSQLCRSLKVKCCRRAFHISICRRDLIAPPHPISHIRPILYEGAPSHSPAPHLRHPYSLSEFKTGAIDDCDDYELQYKLLRQQLDSFHHSFWLDVRTKFCLFIHNVDSIFIEQYTVLCCKKSCGQQSTFNS